MAIIGDIGLAAEWMAKALTSSGYRADFTPSSLREVERFFDDHAPGGTPRPNGVLATDWGRKIFGLGAYLGEVIRRSQGGTWVGDDDDPQAEITVELHLADGTICWPTQRAMKRFRNGPEDDIVFYATALGVAVPAAQSRRGIFRRSK